MSPAPDARPRLEAGLPADAFRAAYWLRAELADFCRANGLSAAGGKAKLAERIARFLETGERSAPPPAPRRPRPPKTSAPLTPDTVIPPGMRCTQEVRAFFEREVGPGFRFDARMREFLWNGAGRTLGDAVEAWHRPRDGETAIAPQFEYNRHVRAYFAANPGATHREAVEAWWVLRGGRPARAAREEAGGAAPGPRV